MKHPLTLATLLLASLAALHAADAPGRWRAERVNAWYAQQPWLVGCHFLPSTAVNDVEMWQPDTFDEATIECEIGWAQSLGFNTVRVFLNSVVWDLYNEPGNSGMGEKSRPLLEAAFG